MTREEAIANLNMISVAFVEPVTKEQRTLIDDTFDIAIKALEQEPKIGHWKYFESTYDGDIYKCSICKCAADVPTVLGIPMFKYCPNCGARMTESENKE